VLIDLLRIPLSAGALFDDSQYKELLNWIRYHHPASCAAECDGLEDPPYVRTIGIASYLAPGHCGTVGDTLPDQAVSGVAWHGFLSKRHLGFFKELFPLRLRKSNDQPG